MLQRSGAEKTVVVHIKVTSGEKDFLYFVLTHRLFVWYHIHETVVRVDCGTAPSDTAGPGSLPAGTKFFGKRCPMSFKDRLKEKRLEANLTQVQLAEKISVSARTNQNYEMG